MSDQLALTLEPRAPFQRRSPSSRDGALAAEGALDSQLARALRAYRRAGGRGLTDRELAHVTGFAISVCCARRNELIKCGLVQQVGRRLSECPDATAVSVGCWAVTEKGRRA